MEENFSMLCQKDDGELYVSLKGELDASAAQRLSNILNLHSMLWKKIIVDTSELENIYQFGLYVFHEDFSNKKNQLANIIFTGPHSDLFQFEGGQKSYLPGYVTNSNLRR